MLCRVVDQVRRWGVEERTRYKRVDNERAYCRWVVDSCVTIAVRDDRGDKGSLLFMSDMIAVPNSVDAVVMLEEAREMEAGRMVP